MRKYLASLPDKPDHHKKRFAFLASGTFTLMIFGFWSLAHFGLPSNTRVVERQNQNEVSPFESLKGNLATPLEALKNQFRNLGESMGDINIESEYQNIRQDALNSYGR